MAYPLPLISTWDIETNGRDSPLRRTCRRRIQPAAAYPWDSDHQPSPRQPRSFARSSQTIVLILKRTGRHATSCCYCVFRSPPPNLDPLSSMFAAFLPHLAGPGGQPKKPRNGLTLPSPTHCGNYPYVGGSDKAPPDGSDNATAREKLGSWRPFGAKLFRRGIPGHGPTGECRYLDNG